MCTALITLTGAAPVRATTYTPSFPVSVYSAVATQSRCSESKAKAAACSRPVAYTAAVSPAGPLIPAPMSTSALPAAGDVEGEGAVERGAAAARGEQDRCERGGDRGAEHGGTLSLLTRRDSRPCAPGVTTDASGVVGNLRGGSYMLGQFAGAVPEVPDDPDGAVDPDDPVDPVEGVLVDGVVVVLVAALAATAPPATRAPETARTAAALRIGLMCFTSLVCSSACSPVSRADCGRRESNSRRRQEPGSAARDRRKRPRPRRRPSSRADGVQDARRCVPKKSSRRAHASVAAASS